MSGEDHQLLFADSHTSVPTAALLQGQWNGNLIFVEHPNSTILNQLNPVVFQLAFATQGTQLQARYKFGLISTGAQVAMTPEFARLSDVTAFQGEIRMIDTDTLIGKWVAADLSSLADSLRNFVESSPSQLTFYYILTRVKG
jgi:membrane glycosyltransferase